MEGVFVTLFICFASYAYNRKSVSFVSPRLIEEGLDPSHAGLIITCQNAAFAVSKFLAGVLSDRINPRILFSSGLLVGGITTLLFSSCSSVPVFCGLWFLNGLSQGCGWPSCAKIIRQRASPTQFGTLWSLLASGHNFSGSLSPILSAYLVTNYGWRFSVFCAGITSILLSLFCLIALKGTSNHEENSSKSTKTKVKSKDQNDSSSTFSELLKDPFLWMVSIGFLVVFCAKTTMVDWGQLHLMTEKKRSQYDGSAFISSVESGGFLGRILVGYLTDYLIRRQEVKADPSKRLNRASARLSVAVICMVISIIAIRVLRCAVKETSSLLWIVVLGFVIGATLYGAITIFGIVASESAPAHLSGSSHAIASLAGNIGGITSGFPLCYVAKQFNWSMVFLLLETSLSAAMLLVLGCRNIQPRSTEREKAD